ncbi:MAG TPA: hypothetical protein VEK08_22680 [Planctomycetota bacterium]|nr:hypothetical protein [Planctomycetota bacterium]
MKTFVIFFAALALLIYVPARPLAHESPIDHVDRDIRIWVAGESIYVSYQLQLSERAAMMQLHKMDVDASGTVSDTERRTYFADFAAQLVRQLQLKVGTQPVSLKPDSPVKLLPQFRQKFIFSGPVGRLPKGKTPGRIDDLYSRSYPGNYRFVPARADQRQDTKVIVTEAPKPVDASGHAGTLQIKFEIDVP